MPSKAPIPSRQGKGGRDSALPTAGSPVLLHPDRGRGYAILHYFLLPATWNVDVMARAPAAALGQGETHTAEPKMEESVSAAVEL